MRPAKPVLPFHRGYFMLSGVIGVAFYVTHVVLGGILWDGYDHLMRPISDLTASGAPDRNLLQTLAFMYGVFCIFFSIRLAAYCKRNLNKTALAGSVLFLAMHLVSISYGLFPQDLPGEQITFAGIMHLAVTALIIPLTIMAPLLTGLGMVRVNHYRRFGIFSVVCGALILLFGGTTAYFFANRLPFFGLMERLNIGTLQAWTAAASIYFFLKESRLREKG